MSGLPSGWASAPIGSLCTLENGRAFKPTEWQTSGLPIVRIQNLNKPTATYNYYSGQFDERYLLRGGELLFAWSGTPGTSFGAHIWRGEKAVLNQHIFRVDFDETLLDKRFFRHAINQKLEELIGIAHGGVGLRHVTKGKFENTETSIPPFCEQKRIADKLDAVLARVDACRDRLDRVPAILKRFRQSVLAAATSGKLTEEWREDIGKNLAFKNFFWQKKKVSEIFDVISGYAFKSGDFVNCGVPVIKISNVQYGIFEEKNQEYLPEEMLNVWARFVIKGGDLLLALTRPITNGQLKICRYPELSPYGLLNQRVCKLQVNLGYVQRYFEFAFQSQEFIDMVQGGISETLQPNLSPKALENFEVSVPSLEEQQEIVLRVESLFAYADRLEARYTAARAQVEKLTPALLAKAFRGELVPHDPSDEPASKLLERIRAINTPELSRPHARKAKAKGLAS